MLEFNYIFVFFFLADWVCQRIDFQIKSKIEFKCDLID